ncbi:MAG: His/Gly/Thr/Pro-type tRNA ligase C-terminal domain-containing protein, partial [Cyanobacteria bacterium P01_H01_bin.26]
RQAGCSVEIDLSSSAFGKQFKRADRSGAVGCLILGDAEAKGGSVQLKWLRSGEQTELSQSALLGQVDTLKDKVKALRLKQF